MSWQTPYFKLSGVKPFKLAGSSTLLVVFVSAESAAKVQRDLGPGLIAPIQGEYATFRMCSGSKSFCLTDNFSSSNSTCRLHQMVSCTSGMHESARPHMYT